MPLGIEGVHIHGQAAALELPGIHGAHGVAEGETAVEVGPAGDRGQLKIRFDVTVDELETFDRKRGAGGEHGAQRFQIILSAGLDP